MNEEISFLQRLVQIKTINDNEKQAAVLIQELLTKNDIKSKLISSAPNRSNLVAEIGNPSSSNIIGFSGHLDVVSPGDINTWQQDPFLGTVIDNKMYGRGTSDMKGGIVAILFAFIKLSKNKSLPGRIRLLLTIGEENGATGANQLTKEHYVDDLSALIVGEATNNEIVFAHKGSLNYTISSYGKQVHSSKPNLGINAIDGLNEFINMEKLLFIHAQQDDTLGDLIHSITIINSGDQINNIPASGYLRGNIRPTLKFNNNAVITTLKNAISKINDTTNYQLKLRIDHSFNPIKTDKNAKIILATKKAISKVTNHTPTLGIFSGATDASEFTLSDNNFETIIFGPGDNNINHQVNEYVDTREVTKFIHIYEQIAYAYFN